MTICQKTVELYLTVVLFVFTQFVILEYLSILDLVLSEACFITPFQTHCNLRVVGNQQGENHLFPVSPISQ